MATVPPMRVCSSALDSSNSGRTNSTLPAAMRTPANPLSVPFVDSLRKMSPPTMGDSRIDLTRVTPRPPPAYGCVRPLPEVPHDAPARGRDGRVELHATVEVALGLLGLGQHFDPPTVRRLEADATADGDADTKAPLVVPELDDAGRGEDLDGLGRSENGREDEDAE